MRSITITFKTIAETAGLSVSYLDKYPEIKNRIAELRNQQKAAMVGIVNKIPKFQPATDKSKTVIISKLRQENLCTNLQQFLAIFLALEDIIQGG